MFDAQQTLSPAAARLSVEAPFGTLAATRHAAGNGVSGGTVVLWPSIFATAAVQGALIDRLAADHDVLAVDPPGHGASLVTRGAELTMPEIAAATLALLDEAGAPGPVRWVGTSWGGLVGIEAARAEPDRIAHLALLNTPFAWDGAGWGKPRFLPPLARTIGTTGVFADGVAKDFFLPSTRADPARAGAMAAHRATFAEGDGRQLAAAARLIFSTRADARPLLPDLRVPALVVAGARDAMYPVAMQRDAAAAIPGAAFHVVESGHIAAVDAPDAVEALLRDAWRGA